MFDKEYMLAKLTELLAIDSTTGQYPEIEAYIAGEIKALGYEPYYFHKGGVWCDLGGEGNSLCITAHLDDIGLMVRHIFPNGTLKVVPIGGLRPSAAEHTNVRVHSRKGVYSGTVQRIQSSVHVTPADVYNAIPDYDKNICIVLDEDVHSAEEVRALGIRVGDYIAPDPGLVIINDFVKSRFLDDKACAAVLLTVMKSLKEENIALKRNVTAYFSMFEEILHGGSILPPETKDIIALDIAPTGPEQTSDEHKATIFAKDSRFPYNITLVNELVDTAEQDGIDYEIDVFTPSYGTDAIASLQAGYDVRHGAVGHGCSATHGYERTHIDSLREMYKLLMAYVMRG